jgi:hypothetical protein
MIRLFRSAAFLSALLALLLAGCGPGRGRVPVSGTVTFDGQPLENGAIRFGGEQGAAGVGDIVNGRFSMSETGSQGGVLPGNYDVLISSWIEERGSVRADGSFSPGITRIPLVYLDPGKSGLKAEVKAGEANQFSFELKSDEAEGKGK